MDRREFIATIALGSIATSIASSCSYDFQTFSVIKPKLFYSGEITRIAMINDAISLAIRDRTLPDLMHRALIGIPGLPSVVEMGVMFPAKDLNSVISFLAKARSVIFKPNKDNNELRVAIATGYLMHQAIERRIHKNLITTNIDLNAEEKDTAKLYQDAEVVRHLLSDPSLTKVQARTLLSIIDQRLRIKMHTIRPDGTEEKAWVLKLLEWDAAQEDLFDRLAAAIAEPNADKQYLYVEAIEFYDKSSPLINMARNSQAEQLQTDKSLETSLYGRALEDCQRVINLIGQFVNSSLDASALAQKLN